MQLMDKGRGLIVFIRYPEKGKVKSRLARDLDEESVAVLYGCFVDDLLGSLKTGNHKLLVAYCPAEKGTETRRRFGVDHEYLPQTGRDLGERMKNAFARCFSDGYNPVVLIGSDCPDLTVGVIEGAFQALESGYDVVIGPALDGGYYMIGFRKDTFHADAFNEIPWGTDAVVAATLQVLSRANYWVHLSRQWRDVDTIEDLLDLIGRNQQTPFARSKTMIFLGEKGY
jgi:rSAM/selenodomain-associated transferase 1